MFTKLLKTGSVVLATTFGFNANAASVDLAFLMESSSKIGSTGFSSAMNSLANALAAGIRVGGPDTYRIGVITFSESAELTTLKTINAQTDLDTVVSDIRSQSFLGTTNVNYERAFNLTVASFGALGDSSIVNVMTSGDPDRGNTASGLLNLRNAGWSSLSFMTPNSNTAQFLSTGAFDTGGFGGTVLGDASGITDPVNDAFVLSVSDLGQDYERAISRNILQIVGPNPAVVPLPAGLPLLAGGLLMFGLLGRRSKAI